jgi:hypothetical protein
MLMHATERLIACAVVAVAAITGCSSQATVGAATTAATPTAPSRDFLTAASCVGESFCVAVGSNFRTGVSLAERWNGSRWRVMRNSAASTGLTSVSCTSSSFCMAAGDGAAQEWNGTAWRLLTTPPTSGRESVSCAKATFCVVVGPEPAQKWNGRFWRMMPPLQSGVSLASVDCVSASFCMAVGSQSNHQQTFVASRALIWNGATWHATDPPSPSRFATLTGVWCSSASRCLAIGSQGHCAQPPQPLGPHCFFSLRWDGAGWKKLPSRSDTPLVAYLACSGATSCVAVGDCNEPANCRGTTTLEWNGRAWRQQTAPAPGRHGSSLDGVACWRRSACMATGGYVTAAGALRTLVEKWNGTRWQVLPTPSP